MTVEKGNYIKIPTALVSVLLPLVVAAVIGYGTAKASISSTQKQVEMNTQVLEKKVDKEVYDLLQKNLDEIKRDVKDMNKKLDSHIMKEDK